MDKVDSKTELLNNYTIIASLVIAYREKQVQEVMVAHFIESEHLGRNSENSLLNRECDEMGIPHRCVHAGNSFICGGERML
jgi:hypothetical protein